ncbi:hypothetical protein ABGB12_02880 [Actinocorallia sp. B10E7]|uniref:hypothetical protein n=1 Tax=Actinocorallia sp. B10E7 TaxID=3153558 RepID=UPI00325C73CF
MPVVLLLAAVAVVAATAVLASGRGGELREPAERLPTGLPEDRLPTGMDGAMLRLPKGFFGYDMAVTDEALGRLVYALMQRENEVAELRRKVAELSAYGAGGELSASWLRKPEETREDDTGRLLKPEEPAEPRKPDEGGGFA